jgi:tetratricopeptide (TPR) repeat protein
VESCRIWFRPDNGDEQVEQTIINNEKSWHLLEKQQLFSQSVLWDIQRQYFAEKGSEAWRLGEVPHYVTSNPTLANSYAEIVFAFLGEQSRLATADGECDEPLYLCELGAGSGRFAFHFLKRLTLLCELGKIPTTSFCYVLTDFTQSNLDFWRSHPGFQPFFESGVLDVALFDVNESEQFTLQRSGKTITAGGLNRPLVVIANYVFDSIPQDLYYFDAQQGHPCLVSLTVDEDPNTLNAAELLARLRFHYDCQTFTEPPYQEPYLQQLLAAYQRTLTDTYLLFPAVALRSLQRLKVLSKQGLLLLSADKGDHRLSALQGKTPPDLVLHGSFSLSVNYHAFKTFCEQSGGLALFPSAHHRSLDISCLLMLTNATAYVDTRHAYQGQVQDFSPDDFHTIMRHARQYIAAMSVEDILAYLRFSYYDSAQFAHYLPRLMELAPELNRDERQSVCAAVDKVWEMYFPLGEELDLAYQIACLLYNVDDYVGALTYFERSIEIYGPHTGTFYNLAACHQLVGQFEQAQSLLRKVLQYDPDNQQARALLVGDEV